MLIEAKLAEARRPIPACAPIHVASFSLPAIRVLQGLTRANLVGTAASVLPKYNNDGPWDGR